MIIQHKNDHRRSPLAATAEPRFSGGDLSEGTHNAIYNADSWHVIFHMFGNSVYEYNYSVPKAEDT